MNTLAGIDLTDRIKLRAGIQTALILQLKKRAGLTWEQIACFLNTSKYTISDDWKRERCLIPRWALKKISRMLGLMDSQIIHYIDEVKPANWGQSKGGKLSAKSLSKIVNFPSKDDRLAEFVGIMLGDGNVFSKDYQNTTVNCIKIAGNPKTGTSYILDFVKPLLESLFGTKVSVYVNKKGNEIFLTLHGKNIIKFVERIGLPRGNKVKNMPTIPEWVFEDERHLKVCVRGLVDTDGSIYALKPHYPNLLQICFKNKNPRLLADFRIALQKLGFHPSKISWNKVYLTRQAEIDRYVREIGFNNPNHLKRYLEVRARFCRDSGQVFI